MKAGVIFKLQFNENWNEQYIDYIDDKEKSLNEIGDMNYLEDETFYNDILNINTISEKKASKNQIEVVKKMYYIKKNETLQDLSLESADELIKRKILNKSFVEYIKDDEKNQNKTLINKQTNSKMNSCSFDFNNNYLSEKQIEAKKKAFKSSSENGSMLWKGVISFDSEFLYENQILIKEDDKTIVDDERIKENAKLAVNTFIEKSNFVKSNIIFHAGIHYNTDNIHIHFAISEKKASRKKGVQKIEVLEKTKSSIVNNMLEDLQEKKTNDFYKRELLNNVKKIKKNKILKKELIEIAQKLPKKGRISYNSKNLNFETKKEIQNLMYKIIKESDIFNDYAKALENQVEKYKKSYGGKKAENYKSNKIKSLESLIGNYLISEMKNINNSEDIIKKEENFINIENQSYELIKSNKEAKKSFFDVQQKIKKTELYQKDNIKKRSEKFEVIKNLDSIEDEELKQDIKIKYGITIDDIEDYKKVQKFSKDKIKKYYFTYKEFLILDNNFLGEDYKRRFKMMNRIVEMQDSKEDKSKQILYLKKKYNITEEDLKDIRKKYFKSTTKKKSFKKSNIINNLKKIDNYLQKEKNKIEKEHQKFIYESEVEL